MMRELFLFLRALKICITLYDLLTRYEHEAPADWVRPAGLPDSALYAEWGGRGSELFIVT